MCALLGLLRVNSCLFEVFNSYRLTQMDKNLCCVCSIFVIRFTHGVLCTVPFELTSSFQPQPSVLGSWKSAPPFRHGNRSDLSAIYCTHFRLFVSRRMTDHSVGCSPWPEIVDTRSSRNGSCRSPLAQVGRTSRLHAIIRFMTQPNPDTSLSSAPSKNISVKK